MTRTTLAALVLAIACTPPDDATVDSDPPDAVRAWCDGATTQAWDPLVAPELKLYPDPLWTTPDPASPTGLRLHVDDAPWLGEFPTGIVALAGPLDELSGFGRLGAAVLRFDGALGALPADAAASLTDPGLILAELTEGGPVRVPYRATLGKDGTQLLVQPLAVLAPAARHVVVLTTAHVAADGGCVAPSPTFRALWDDRDVDGRLAALRPDQQAALDALGLTPEDVSALTVFTTHGEVGVVEAAGADAVADTYTWASPPTCSDTGTLRHCDGKFVAHDYRTAAGGVLGATPQADWTLDVELWLPKSGDPAPVVVFGHGMNGDRHNAGSVANDLVARGFAVVASDALDHGDHPSTEGLVTEGGLPFLGIGLAEGGVSLRHLRGTFVQTGLDRAQVLALLRDAPDVDGDQAPDVDTSRVGYVGVSLGGLLGPAFLEAWGGAGAAVLQVAGGHLVVFVTETGVTASLHDALVGLVGTEDGLQRFLAVAQSAIDGADPAVLAAHVTGAVASDAAPDVLLQCAHHDEVVPPATGEMMARGLVAPRLAPGAWTVDAVTTGPARAAPVVGYQQFEQVSSGGHLVDADHDVTPGSPEAWGQALHFLTTWRDTGTAEIVPPVTP